MHADVLVLVVPGYLDVVIIDKVLFLPLYIATADQDYTGLPSMFSFVTGQSLSCTLIEIIDDNTVESRETISLILQPLDSSPGVRISRGLSTVEIVDNDIGKT